MRAQDYENLGYHVERGVFGAQEMEALGKLFMDMHARGGVKGFYEPFPSGMDDGFHYKFSKNDPLSQYPRVMHPQKFMPEAKEYLLDSRLEDILEDLLGEGALAAQSMFYYKPPGGRGQAWHQDNFYLNVAPGTCIAAWVAVDASDEDNGGLQVIPKTNRIPVLCPDTNADPKVSFTKEVVPMTQLVQTMGATYGQPLKDTPEGVEAHKLRLRSGDVLFFNGSVVHGSGANESRDRFRRSFICHYMGASSLEIAAHYHPLLDRQGREVGRKIAEGGGPCGTEQAEPH
jgi:hypothetical protein